MASNEVIRESAISWIQKNTTFDVNVNPLPSNVELFIEKYGALMGLRPGVASESISGLSQSFNSADIGTMLKQYARELIGDEYMLSDVKALPAIDRWVY